MTLSDTNIVAVLNAIDESQIDGAQLAQYKATTADLRAFASRVVQEHKAMRSQTELLSQQTNLLPENPRLVTALRESHHEMMSKLRSKGGTAFDRAYIEQEIQLHVRAIQFLQDTMEWATDSALHQQLIRTGPELKSHLSGALAIERRLLGQ